MNKRVLSMMCTVLLAACGTPADEFAPRVSSRESALTPQESRGKDIWFKSTFGGEKFFTLILPNAPFNLQLGLVNVLTSSRDTRFDQYGVLNDPDCTAGDVSTGYLDRCPDPNATGVVGIRRFQNPQPTGPRVLVGIACASCHAGLDPTHPPADPDHPQWENIIPTIGNQYLDTGKIFRANLSPHDPRYQVFHSWVPGTLDTTAIENDHINNPGIITPIFDLPDRPFFDFVDHGMPIHVHRAGQGGEDDVGCEGAALRVYFNIGMCAAECMIGHLQNGPGNSQTPIDTDQCRRDCPPFAQAERSVADLCAFLQTPRVPLLKDAPGGPGLIDQTVVDRGRQVFHRECAGCHSNGQPQDHDVLSDDQIHPAADIGTNSCRSRTSNWEAGHIWAPFSSDTYKARATGGPGFYRDLPLLGLWATAPFFHNNSLGSYSGDFSVAGRVAAFANAMDQLLNPWKRDLLGSIRRTSDRVDISTPLGNISLPAGTPVALFANLDPHDPLHNLCPDLIENQGHYYGALLSAADKHALTEYLKTH